MKIELSDIIDLDPANRVILVVGKVEYLDMARNSDQLSSAHMLEIEIDNAQEFNKYKFEALKFIKKKKNSSERIFDFEWRDENNIRDFEKKDRIIDKRKTREERKSEVTTLSNNIDKYKAQGLDTAFLEEQLKERLRRGTL